MKLALDRGVGSTVTCAGTTFLLTLARTLQSEQELRQLFYSTCTSFNIESKEVCNGLAITFCPSLFFILTQSKLTPAEMTAILLGPDCMDRDMFMSSKSLNWKIAVPLKTGNGQEKEKKVDLTTTKRLLHLSDVHLDLQYAAKAVANCAEPLCCRPSSGAKSGTDTGSAGMWGEILGNCDAPQNLAQNVLQQINLTLSLNASLFDYVIFTGDMTPHDVWSTSRDDLTSASRTWTSLLTKYLPQDMPVFPVLGNHEGLPVNM